MLQQILSDMHVDPELLAELDEDQKQILFCKMREEQVRRWREREKEQETTDKAEVKEPCMKIGNKKVKFLLGADNEPWVWVMGEHKDDKSIEDILEMEAKEHAAKIALEEATALRIKEENEVREKLAREEKRLELEVRQREDELRRKTEEAARQVRKEETKNVSKKIEDDQIKRRKENEAKLKQTEMAMRRRSIERVNQHLEKRSTEIASSFKEARHRLLQTAEESSKTIEEEWRKQEQKAKEKEHEIRATARRAREEHRMSLKDTKAAAIAINAFTKLYIEQKTHKKRLAPPVPQRGTGPVSRGNKLPKPGSKAEITDWFRKSEKEKGTGLDSQTQKVQPWFHGIISRDESEQLLSNKRYGSFLVRVSERVWGYAISHKGKDRVKHFLVDASDGFYTFFGVAQKSHTSLEELVLYHKEVPISRAGLEYLLYPCSQQVDPPDYYELFYDMQEENSRL